MKYHSLKINKHVIVEHLVKGIVVPFDKELVFIEQIKYFMIRSESIYRIFIQMLQGIYIYLYIVILSEMLYLSGN